MPVWCLLHVCMKVCNSVDVSVMKIMRVPAGGESGGSASLTWDTSRLRSWLFFCPQIHILESGEVRVFSRNQEDNTSKYPDIIARIPKVRERRSPGTGGGAVGVWGFR